MNISKCILTKLKRTVVIADSDQITNCLETGKLLEGLQIKSEKMYMPFGVSSFENKFSSFADYQVSVYVSENDTKTLDSLDARVQELGHETGILNFDSCEWRPILKKNKDFPRLLTLKLPRDKNGNFETIVFDEDKNKIMIGLDNIEEIFCKKRTFKCVFQNVKVWEYNGAIGSIWKILQIRYCRETVKKTDIIEDDIIEDEQTHGVDYSTFSIPI